MPFRRLLTLALGLAVLGSPGTGGLAAARSAPTAAESAPNVLVIVTDDQRTGTLAVMPATKRWFAGKGMTFSQGFATTPLCCPSRASIFTGRYAHNHQVQANDDGSDMDPGTTMQQRLGDAGYETAIAGKYLNAWDLSAAPPNFDRWAIFNAGYHDATFNVDGRLRTVKKYSTDFVAAKAKAFLEDFEDDDEQPWLLYVAPFAPHRPATPAPRHENEPVPKWNKNPAVTELDRSDKPPYVQDRNATLSKTKKVRRKQLRSLMAVDELVAGLMAKLGALKERDDTLAVFLSDNGFMWREHGLLNKRVPYLQSVEVPFFMRWPGEIPAGETDGRLVANIDVAPTALDAAGLTSPTMDGRSLLSSWERTHLLLEYWEEGKKAVPTWASAIAPALQYIEYYDAEGVGVTFEEYYALDSDPWQLDNLLRDGDHTNDPPPDVLTELSLQLVADRRCQGTIGPTACP